MAAKWTKTTAAADLSDLDNYANDIYKKLCALRAWPFMEGSRTATTTASTQFTNIPNDMMPGKIGEISVVPNGSTIRYTPKLSPSREHWDQLNLTTFVSDIPEWYFIFNGQVGLWPTPAQTGNTITLVGGLRAIDLAIADYTTGGVQAIANGATAMTGTGTTWTTNMQNEWISVTLGNAANSGDGQWYQIASVGSSTSITLSKSYTGLSISAANAAYTIGQLPLLPEAFHDTPWKWAAAQYWIKEADPRAKSFADMYNADVEQLVTTYSTPSDAGYVIDDGRDQQIINPNLVIRL